MIDKIALSEVVRSAIAGTDLFVVDITVSADNIIDVELDSLGSVTLDDCMMVNDAVLAAFNRDEEDYELTVGSYGITAPFKVPQHYQKNLGGEVEVLTRDGRKLKGTLKAADEKQFTLTVAQKVKTEGKKRPEIVETDLVMAMDEVKYTKNIITF